MKCMKQQTTFEGAKNADEKGFAQFAQLKTVSVYENKKFRQHKMLKILILILITLLVAKIEAILTPGPRELQVIEECLASYGGLTPENAERLQRYKLWSETYEEIPCFTNCYLNKMFGIYNESIGFIPENIIKQFGQSFYDACRYRMQRQGRNNCQLAYSGFHCIVNLENDPFVLIENMKNTDFQAKNAMKDCLRKFDSYEWHRLSDYPKFPVREPIPCYTKCFIDELQLFNERSRHWNISKMRSKLGVPLAAANINSCLAMSKRRNRNSCAWIYNEFTCYTLST